MLKRRAALAIARDLRRAERIVDDLVQEHDPAAHREVERILSSALARMMAVDDDRSGNDYAPALAESAAL